MDTTKLESTAKRVRRDIIDMIYSGGSGHPGGSLSAADIMTVLYFYEMRIDPKNPEWEDRDRFILSKGHASTTLYAVLAERGYFSLSLLKDFSADDSPLQKHPERGRLPGVEFSTGALGQGISAAVGIALDGKISGKDFRVYGLIGDGECNEGQVWEAAMAAPQFKLDNLTVFLDYNKLQVDGTNEEIIKLEPMDMKWTAFGWNVKSIDGHDIEAIISAMEEVKSVTDKPSIIISNTVKGKGVSFIEDRVEWHARSITKEEYETAMRELQ